MLSYCLQLERLEREVHALAQGAVVARATGADVDIPNVYDARDEFDELLRAAPERVDPDRQTLRVALGLPLGR